MKRTIVLSLCLLLPALATAQFMMPWVKSSTGPASGGGGWTPTTEGTDLKRWFKADALSLSNDDPISTFTDSSGNGNTVTQTGSARPTYKTNITNGLPGALFSAGNSKYMSGSAITGGSAKSWLIVYTATSDASPLLGTLAGMANYTNFGGAGYFGEFRTARIDNYPATMPTSGVVVIVGVSTGSTYQVWIDDVAQSAQSAAFSAGDIFYLGANGNLSAYWNSYIFEYAEFDTNVASTKHTDMFNYASNKWQ